MKQYLCGELSSIKSPAIYDLLKVKENSKVMELSVDSEDQASSKGIFLTKAMIVQYIMA